MNREIPKSSNFEAYHYEVESCSVASDKHPERNEDAHFALDSGIAGVFDGMGGHPGSEAASRLVADYCLEALRDTILVARPEDVCDLLGQTILDANQALITEYRETNIDIATTATLAAIAEDPVSSERFACIAHVGDSRAYIYSAGDFVFSTLDDSTVAKLTKEEQRMAQDEVANTYYRHEVDPYFWNYIYERNYKENCLRSRPGRNTTDVNKSIVRAAPGDQILIVSDGITDNLMDREIAGHLFTSGAPSKDIVEAARQHSREDGEDIMLLDEWDDDLGQRREFRAQKLHVKPDDMTAVVIRVK